MKFRALILSAVLIVSVRTVPAQTFTVLHNFGSSIGEPLDPGFQGIIAQGRDGNMYSTTSNGGTKFSGDVFKITPTGAVTSIHNFDGILECLPLSGLALGVDGNFYGTTEGCGTSMVGTVFKSTTGGAFTALYNFTGMSDGGLPTAAPIQASDGSFYGTVRGSLTGGGMGTVYKLTPGSPAKFTTLYQFDGTHGQFPAAALVQGADGNFYGTTEQGGSNAAGVVFKITLAGKLTVLFNFDTAHGADPVGPLVQANNGSLYGTAQKGGTNNSGVVFKITTNGLLTVLHNFNETTDGGGPTAGLVQATDGNFYGVASTGGSKGDGTIFKVNSTGTIFSVIHDFDGVTGQTPQVTLIQNTNGILYGNTFVGGTRGEGTFYSLNLGLHTFVRLLPYSGKVHNLIEFLGQGFTSASTISFNGTVVKPMSVSASGTYLTAAIPNGATTGYVTVTASSGTLKSDKIFRVVPQITGFSPMSGTAGTSVTITGLSLKQTTRVSFGGVKATFTADSDSQVTATVPMGILTGKIAITTPGGIAVSSGTFTVSNALDGYCLHPGLSCGAEHDPNECPPGAMAMDPGCVQCGFPIERTSVDLARSCNFGEGFCSTVARCKP